MVDDFIGLIPAAGKGLRLGLPYPKELYPIIRDNHYKPIAQFVLTNLTVAGLQHVVFVINETKHQLISYFGNGQRFGCQISYVVQERLNHHGKSTSPGLAHALDSAYHLVKNKTVFFGMADTIMQPVNVSLNCSSRGYLRHSQARTSYRPGPCRVCAICAGVWITQDATIERA